MPPLVTGELPCLHVGVDENGLGPILGPMIVTAVAFRVVGPRPRSLGALVGDSKALVSHGDTALGEAWARALLGALGPDPSTPAEVLARLSLDEEAVLRAPCPRGGDEGDGRARAQEHHAATMCWPTDASSERFVADDALVERCARIVRGWGASSVGATAGRFVRRTPVELVGARAVVVCASRLNEEKTRGRHKFLVDLHSMERLALALHEAAIAQHGDARVGPLDAVCGKVGGMGFYGDNFGPLSSRLFAIEAESRVASAYRFPGLGRFTFLQDADAVDPLVGLASLVGKYLRELTMARVVRYMRAAVTPQTSSLAAGEELPEASGYRDPITRRFVAATELVRAHRGVPDRCFLRRS